jgi:hypothetical protein
MSRRSELSQITAGIFLVFGLHIFVLSALGFTGFLIYTVFSLVKIPSIDNLISSYGFLFGLFAVFGIGIFQLFYVVPTVIFLKRKRQFSLMKGVIIGAVITALLNGGCYLIILASS